MNMLPGSGDDTGRRSRGVLVVEDEPVIAELLTTVLSRAGFEVDVAHRVDDAVDRLRSRSYDLCLSDFLLPDRTGLDLAREMAVLRPGLRMILITAFLEAELEQQVRSQPCVVEIVRKPMDVFKLRDLVSSLTADSSAGDPQVGRTQVGDPQVGNTKAGGEPERELEC